jgi:hypothetical protein
MEIVMGAMGWIIPAIVAGLGRSPCCGAWHFLAGRIGRGAQHGIVRIVWALGGARLLLGLNTAMYTRLTHEGPVEEISEGAGPGGQSLQDRRFGDANFMPLATGRSIASSLPDRASTACGPTMSRGRRWTSRFRAGCLRLNQTPPDGIDR